MTFRAFAAFEAEDGSFFRRIVERNVADLPEGDTLIRVVYSSLNYKDALSASGNRGITKHYPHTPGIDAAGFVVESPVFSIGEQVLVTGYDLGMNTSGGFGEYVRVPSSWVLKRPEGLSLMECMIYGTAGLTAGLSVSKLVECGISPESGEILVTGATGGVGLFALGMLAKMGFRVAASSGKKDAEPLLKSLGAKDVVPREEEASPKPLLKGRWAGVVDTVGGEILVNALKSTQYGGVVTCCGMVASTEFRTSIFPFILRGVSLHGIDAAQCPMASRKRTWEMLSGEWKPGNLDRFHATCTLEELDGKIESMLSGKSLGRVVVSHHSPP